MRRWGGGVVNNKRAERGGRIGQQRAKMGMPEKWGKQGRGETDGQ